MKIIAVIQADLEGTPIGTRSRVAVELAGTPILRRTVERTQAVRQVDDVYVLCPSSQADRCAALIAGTGAIVRTHSASPAPWGQLVQAARKWSLDGWRGGIGGTTSFDEFTDCRLIGGVLQECAADEVLSVPPAAPLFDPELAERMIEHKHTTDEEVRMVFCQAPPGLAGVVLDAALAHELAGKNSPIGWTFSYQPDEARKDLIFQPCCYEVPRELRHTTGRLIADTDRALETITALLQDHESPDSAAVGRWLMQRMETHVQTHPREVEIELTTEDPYPNALLRPRGERVGHRGPIDPALVARISAEVSVFDDALVVLGGFGDPLRHPEFRSILETLAASREAGRGPHGLAVRTTGVDLDESLSGALVTCGVDILEVTMDAWTVELYGRLQSPHDPAAASLEAIRANLDILGRVRQERGSVRPIVVPEFTKARQNVHEMDDFYDGWLRQQGAAAITGYCHYCGQMEDHSVITMTPPTRVACRRLGERCLILADGQVTMCDQDLRGQHTLGSLAEQDLGTIWHGAELSHIRQSHRANRFDSIAPCPACAEWHRP